MCGDAVVVTALRSGDANSPRRTRTGNLTVLQRSNVHGASSVTFLRRVFVQSRSCHFVDEIINGTF